MLLEGCVQEEATMRHLEAVVFLMHIIFAHVVVAYVRNVHGQQEWPVPYRYVRCMIYS